MASTSKRNDFFRRARCRFQPYYGVLQKRLGHARARIVLFAILIMFLVTGMVMLSNSLYRLHDDHEMVVADRVLQSSFKCLVIILGQTRAHELTWDSFKTNLLDELQCDLALCVGTVGENTSNPFYTNAKFVWTFSDQPQPNVSEVEQWRRVYRQFYGELMPNESHWDGLYTSPGDWISPLNNKGNSGGISLFYRQFLHSKLMENNGAIYNQYDYFMYARSDYLYACKFPRHVVLDPLLQSANEDFILFTDTKHYGGVQDRNLIASRKLFSKTINIVEDVMTNPTHWIQYAQKQVSYFNIESAIKHHLIRNDLWQFAKFYHPTMFIVRSHGKLRNIPSQTCFSKRCNCQLKHCGEDREAEANCIYYDPSLSTLRKWLYRLYFKLMTPIIK